MGIWGIEPWANDLAADWFSQLFEETSLAEKVECALRLDPAEYAEEIRAAAYILQQLGRPYVWPIDKLAHQLELAVAQLSTIANSDASPHISPELRNEIRKEIARLRGQLRNLQS